MRIGFIGLGNMGGPMALNLIKANHQLTVHDQRREAVALHLAGGARWAETPAAVAQESEIVFTSLPGPKEVEKVALGADGIITGISRGAIYADLSTNSPSLVRRMYKAFGRHGVAMIDCPVSGGVIGARHATLAVMAGGDEEPFKRVAPVLNAIGDKVSHIGAIGAGTVAKLVHNMIVFCVSSALAEGFTLGVKAGVPAEALLTAIKEAAFGQGLLLTGMLPKMVFKGNFDRVTFALRLARKDLGLATELAREYDVPMAIASKVEQDMVEAIVRGLGDKDASATFLLQEERAGVAVRSS